METLPKYPYLYETNTRVWLRRFDTSSRKATLADIPPERWDTLRGDGFDLIWLMGVWKTNLSCIEKYGFHPALESAYREALPDYKKEDVIGSPYAIDDYRIHPGLGTAESLRRLRQELHRRGIRLVLDFIPNHFSADSTLIRTHPEYFIQGTQSLFEKHPLTFFQHEETGSYFAHGRDPYFQPWTDTVQVNYCNPDARQFMIQRLLELGEICDGIRSDMSMLVLNSVFQETWNHVLEVMNYPVPRAEFWTEAIQQVKQKYPEFIFLGEVYWEKEAVLQEMGFDYTYDKRLADLMERGPADDIRRYLHTTAGLQPRSAHFLENHDEVRAIKKLGLKQSLAAAVILCTLPGLRFFHDGQLEGKTVKLPVQLGREPLEPVNREVQRFYHRLLSITKHPVFKWGEWTSLDPLPAGIGDESFQNLLAWMWTCEQERRLVTVNYSNRPSRCRIVLNLEGIEKELTFSDLFNHQTYIRGTDDLRRNGLYTELEAFQAQIFSF